MYKQRMIISIRTVTLLMLSIVGVTSCGMQGDLYLPEEKTEASAEQAQK